MKDVNEFTKKDEKNVDRMLFFIKNGREIEFLYKNKEYFMGYTGELGRALIDSSGELIGNAFNDDHESFFYNAKIDGKTLYDIFKDNEAEVTGVL